MVCAIKTGNFELFATFLFNFYIHFPRVKFKKTGESFPFMIKIDLIMNRMCDSQKKKSMRLSRLTDVSEKIVARAVQWSENC